MPYGNTERGKQSTLVQLLACCLTAPSHYLNQCWLTISEAHWDSPEGNFTETVLGITDYLRVPKVYIYINTATSPMGQGLKGSMCWTSETKSQSFVHRTIFPSPANVPRELPTHSHTRKYEQVMELYSDIHPHSSTFFSFFFLHEYVQ